jgi:hypothetical protein
MQTTHATKSNLAKLLATENINVEYRKVDTASFNVATRTLVLPVLNDMTNDMEDLFIGHEVGHALDTPKEYGDVQQDMPNGFKTFLNVVEDARIERRIKDRYPGLKKSFNVGYKEFMNRDFFQVKDKDVNKMLLIDRINLYFKIGPFFTVDFTSEEQALVKKVSACETFDDVVSVCKELYDYCKEELEQKRQEAMQEFKEKLAAGEFDDDMDMGDYDEDFSDPFQSEDQKLNPDMFDSDSNDDDENEFEDESNSSRKYSHAQPTFEDNQPEELKDYDEVKSATDESLEKSLRSMTEKKEIRTGALGICDNSVNYKDLIVSYKEFIGQFFDTSHPSYNEDYKANLLIEFENKTKNSVSYLVKEFEMRKKAAELRRTVISDTGTLDTNKLHTYKFNDDIFRKIGSVSAGKNHGIVMFLDWSGSMTDNMSGTIEQLITLTTFCRKVGVPFEVYAFSTAYLKFAKNELGTLVASNPIKTSNGEINFSERFSLLNLFSSRMKNQEYRRMANDLLNYGLVINNYYNSLRRHMNEMLCLGGTPLNATIYAASGIVNRFRKNYKTEIIDVVFLTDGYDSSTLFVKADSIYNSTSVGEPTKYSTSYIQDKETQKRYRVDSNGVTPVLLQILKDRTGCNLIGFYILSNNKRTFNDALRSYGIWYSDDMFKKFRSEKFYAISNYGYDQYFLIPGGKDLSVEDEDLDDLIGNGEVSNRKLKGAFLKMNQNRLTNRVLLSKVIEEIA